MTRSFNILLQIMKPKIQHVLNGPVLQTKDGLSTNNLEKEQSDQEHNGWGWCSTLKKLKLFQKKEI